MVSGICILLGLQLAHRNRQPMPDPVPRGERLHTGEKTPKAFSVPGRAALLQLASQESFLSQHRGIRHGVRPLLHNELDELLAVDIARVDGCSHTERFRDEAEVSAQVSKGHLSLAQSADRFFHALVHDAQGPLRISMVAAMRRLNRDSGGKT